MVASLLYIGCKSATTDPNGNNNTITSIGDSVPRLHSNYTYDRLQLDMNNNIIQGSTITGTAIIDSVALSLFGKNNVFSIYDQDRTSLDTSFYTYESNGDVSMYLLSPGFLKNNGNGEQIDETLLTIANLVFHNWITLPIASKKTLNPYDAKVTIDINGDKVLADIHTVVEFIGDSSIVTTKGVLLKPDTVAAKHCKITITANMILGGAPFNVSHVRDIWFVPKIGYIARQMIRTYVPAYSILVIPLDTSVTLKAMTNYSLF